MGGAKYLRKVTRRTKGEREHDTPGNVLERGGGTGVDDGKFRSRRKAHHAYTGGDHE
jgi:hypothetical protein